jgi:hypothetical protein
MTKSTAVKQHEQEHELAEREVNTNLPAQSQEDYADKYEGEETYVDREDTITPRVSILQGLSPQVKRQNVAYVEGAQPGMIFLSSYHQPLIDGEEGIVFQPALFQTKWEVRTPKESGAANYVDMFDEPQPTWTPQRAEKGFTWYKTPDGNNANLIHIHVGLVHLGRERLPYAIRFSGTGMFISKTWNGTIGSRRSDSGKPAARFVFTYRMRVKSQTNSFGEWGQWAIQPEGRATNEEIEMGHALAQAFKKGERVVEREAPGEVAGEQDGTM